MKLYGCKQGFRLERDSSDQELCYGTAYSDPGWAALGMGFALLRISMVVFASPWIFTNSNNDLALSGLSLMATVGDRAPEIRSLFAVDGVSIVKERANRASECSCRAGSNASSPADRVVDADRRPITPAGRRNRPGRKISTVDRNVHGLLR